MFRRKKYDQDEGLAMTETPEDLGLPQKLGARPPGALGATRPTPTPPTPAPIPARPSESPARRISEGHAGPPIMPTPKARDTENRRLIVGREISLSGEITSCDRLVVEGSVEANLTNCREIEIADSGLFKGSATIEEAEIRGRFEGTLTVRKRLVIRATGKVTGAVRYGQLEVEAGGQLTGEIQAQPTNDENEMRLTRPGVPLPAEMKI
jgi:cytoskeletal protein CcmA (bactofilin family)